MYNAHMKKLMAVLVVIAAAWAAPADGVRSYVGAGAQALLPQGSSRMRHAVGGAANAGIYLSERIALETEAAWLEKYCGLSVRALGHFSLWEEFDLLFGCEKFDPFFTFGASGWMRRGQVGPSAGIGAFYYVDDDWALRLDASATLGLDTRREMAYSVTLGIQRAF